MALYHLADLIIESELPLPELTEASGGVPSWRFEQLAAAPEPGGEELNAGVIDGRVWMRILRQGERYFVSFPDVAEFVVSPGDRRVGFFAAEEVGSSTLRHLLIDLVMPHVFAMDGSLVLHASAVGTDRGAVVFSGPSGCGKSSLAAEFVLAGCRLLTDDFALFRETPEGFAVVPSYPGLRLWPDSAAALARPDSQLSPVYDDGEKQRLTSGDTAPGNDPVPLAAIVVLGPQPEDDKPYSVSRASAREGMMSLFGEAFRMERSGTTRAAEEFERFTRLATSVPLLRLAHRRAYETLPAIREAILDEIAVG